MVLSGSKPGAGPGANAGAPTSSFGKAEDDFRLFLKRFRATASLTRKEEQEFENTTIDDVKAVIADIQQKQISSNRQLWLRRLEPFLAGMEQYGKVVEVFLNTSELLAFIWGPMKFMLVVASSFSEALNALLDAYFELGELIPQLYAYHEHCLSNEYMRTVLALIYQDILDFHAYAFKYFKKSTWRQVFQAVWKGFSLKLEELKDNMRRHRHLVESQASIVQFEETQKLRRLAESRFQDLQEEFVRRRWPDVQRWLSAYNSKLQHILCAKAKAECPGSGQWLLNDIRFKSWFDPVYCSTPLLWLNGIPGAGKTILSSTVIDEVQKLAESGQVRVAYFYCKGTDDARNSFVAVARGLLTQLLKGNHDLLIHCYDQGNLQSGEAILLDDDMAKSLLTVALDSRLTTYIIIDGIDECKRDERKEICTWFCERVNELPKEELGNLRCLFVSQEDGFAKKDLSMVPQIKMLPAHTSADIRRYVDSWREKIEAKHGKVNHDDYSLTDAIMVVTRGMFLFAKLMVQYLHKMATREELMKNLAPRYFPEEIGKLYEAILERVLDEDLGGSPKAVRRLLGLLVVAKRPLRWNEIQGCFSFDPGADEVIDYDMRKLREDPKDLCWSLVEHHEDNSVELVHPTARDYLVRTEYLKPSTVELEISQTCLLYLSTPACCLDGEEGTEAVRGYLMKGYYSFFDYAIACWSLHLQAALPEMDGEVNKNLLAEALDSFIGLHWADSSVQLTVSTAIMDKIKLFDDTELSSRLAQALISARKLLGPYGKEPLPEEPLDLGQVTVSVRRAMEAAASDLFMARDVRARLNTFYGDKMFKCPRPNCVCFYDGFKVRSERDLHVAKHERPYNCGDANCAMFTFGYATEKTLQRHLIEVHGIDPGTNVEFPAPPKETKKASEGTHQCPHCPKKFTRAFTLRNHIRIHTKSRPFSCATCSKSFTRQADCKRHEGIHLGEGGHVCRGLLSSGANWGCGRSFVRRDKLGEHWRSASGRRCIVPLLQEKNQRAVQDSSQASGDGSDLAAPATGRESMVADDAGVYEAMYNDPQLQELFNSLINAEGEDAAGLDDSLAGEGLLAPVDAGE